MKYGDELVTKWNNQNVSKLWSLCLKWPSIIFAHVLEFLIFFYFVCFICFISLMLYFVWTFFIDRSFNSTDSISCSSIRIHQYSLNSELYAVSYSLWLIKQFVSFFSRRNTKISLIFSTSICCKIFEINGTVPEVLLKMYNNWLRSKQCG